VASDLRLRGRGFDPRLFCFKVTTLGNLFTQMCLCYQAKVRYRSRGGDADGKVTVGLSSD